MTSSDVQRPSGRAAAQLRHVSFETGISKHAEGSCFIKFGDTHVLCTASLGACRLGCAAKGRAG